MQPTTTTTMIHHVNVIVKAHKVCSILKSPNRPENTFLSSLKWNLQNNTAELTFITNIFTASLLSVFNKWVEETFTIDEIISIS